MTKTVHKITTAIDSKSDQILQELPQDRERATGNQAENCQGNNLSGGIQSRTIRLEFPHFEGSDHAGWVYRVEQFFSYHQTVTPQVRI